MNAMTTENQSIISQSNKETLPVRSIPAQSEVATLRDKVLSRLKTVAAKQTDNQATQKAGRIISSLEKDGVDESFAKLASGRLTNSGPKAEISQGKTRQRNGEPKTTNHVVPDEVRNDPLFQQKLGLALLKARESGSNVDIQEIEKNTLNEYKDEKETVKPPDNNEAKKVDKQYASEKEFLESRLQHAQVMENMAALLYATAARLNGESAEEDNQSLLAVLINLIEWFFGGMVNGEEAEAELPGEEAA